MLYAPESQQLMDRFASEIEDLRTIARLHALPIGSPERLQVLPLRLAKDVRLRSDLTELVRSLQLRDPDLGLPDVLSLLLVAVGGSPSLESRRDMEEVVDLTGGFLASLGGWPGSDVEPVTDLDHPPDHDPRLDLAASTYTEALEGSLAPEPTPPSEAPAIPADPPEPVSDASDGSATSGSVTLAEITHALARLERGNLELRLHLDSIDQRICRMEPLLEGAPPSASIDDLPPRPEPAPAPASSLRTPEPADLMHRGSVISDHGGSHRGSIVSEYEVKRQREEEIKAQRRISLSSNFVDPVPEALKSLATGSPLPQRGAAVTRASLLPERAPDPASPVRALQPRRDRFAAAREIPGNTADTDPLYTATDEELAAAASASTTQTPKQATPVAAASQASSTFATNAAKVPAPDEVYREPLPPVMDRPPKRVEYLKLDPVEAPADRGPRPATSLPDEAEEPPRKRTGVWIGGIAAAAILGAAGFLYINGLPAPIDEWVSGNQTTASSSVRQTEPQPAQAAPAPTTTALVQAPAGSSRAGMQGPGTGVAGRVPETHDATGTSIDRISGPTFVPGGVMDGYLISAPRPQYPQLASLAGVQGKISFEAMISKTGGVEALKVLGGPQLLRRAATDAVKQWQYRPFEVKGRPVEVRTIIRVDVAAKAGAPADQ